GDAARERLALPHGGSLRRGRDHRPARDPAVPLPVHRRGPGAARHLGGPETEVRRTSLAAAIPTRRRRSMKSLNRLKVAAAAIAALAASTFAMAEVDEVKMMSQY